MEGNKMSKFGNPNATGRGSGKLSGRLAKLKRPPKGEPWIWLTRELIESPAWRLRSINCTRLLDFLLVEHMNHAGTENGNLMATHDQLNLWGAGRRHIRPAIEEAIFLGLLKYERGGRWANTNQPSRFRLTFFFSDEDFSPATNEWKGKTEEAIKEWKKDRARLHKSRKAYRKKQNIPHLRAVS
jgi:hypothetical protein